MALNGAQRNILEGTLRFTLDEVKEFLEVAPEGPDPFQGGIDNDRALRALQLILADDVTPSQRRALQEWDIWDCVEQVRYILAHPTPQNRSGNYPYFHAPIDETMVVYKDAFGRAALEKRGLLGLSAYGVEGEEAATKDDVENYIVQEVKTRIAILQRHGIQPAIAGDAKESHEEHSSSPQPSRYASQKKSEVADKLLSRLHRTAHTILERLEQTDNQNLRASYYISLHFQIGLQMRLQRYVDQAEAVLAHEIEQEDGASRSSSRPCTSSQTLASMGSLDLQDQACQAESEAEFLQNVIEVDDTFLQEAYDKLTCFQLCLQDTESVLSDEIEVVVSPSPQLGGRNQGLDEELEEALEESRAILLSLTPDTSPSSSPQPAGRSPARPLPPVPARQRVLTRPTQGDGYPVTRTQSDDSAENSQPQNAETVQRSHSYSFSTNSSLAERELQDWRGRRNRSGTFNRRPSSSGSHHTRSDKNSGKKEKKCVIQ